jgi:hypothetical protein
MSSPASLTIKSTGLMSCYRGIIRGKWTLTFIFREMKKIIQDHGLQHQREAV